MTNRQFRNNTVGKKEFERIFCYSSVAHMCSPVPLDVPAELLLKASLTTRSLSTRVSSLFPSLTDCVIKPVCFLRSVSSLSHPPHPALCVIISLTLSQPCAGSPICTKLTVDRKRR